MIVQEKGFVSPKQFDQYMAAKKFKVKERVITYYFSKTQDLVADTILRGVDVMENLVKIGAQKWQHFRRSRPRPTGANND